MTVSELASKSGYSRQRLNRLVDLGCAQGIERKTNRRLMITDEILVGRWCECLHRRKTERKHRNAQRKENRDRPKIQRLPSLLTTIVNRARQDTASSLSEAFDQIQSAFKGDKQHFKYLAEKWAQTKSREIVVSMLPPIPLYRASFISRGRRPGTRMARKDLFDFALNPGAVPWVESYADIAHKHGCTRAAISAMAKELPIEIPRRSGRYH
jgi:hypothetical protein